ncbi:MAG TPA: hypothetical protein H9903_09425 [Candidatus Aquabacterium excrementipullorum]|nr:hypothetical protein [Candidatus Aquabacterium excrementipullorum]
MKISTTMLDYNLGQITLTYFAEHNEMPEDLSDFDSYIETMRHDAQAAGDLPWLLLGLQQLINDPEIDLAAHGGGVFPLSADDVRDIIIHALYKLNAPGGAAAPLIPVTLAYMTGEDWKAHRATLGTLA